MQAILNVAFPIFGVILVLGVREKMSEAGFGEMVEGALTTTD